MAELIAKKISLESYSVNSRAETELVRKAQERDEVAFEELYRHHVARVYALCLRITADSGRAEELTQDVFVRLWEKIGSFRGESAFSSWLHRLTVNVILVDFRSHRRRESRVKVTEDLFAYDTDQNFPSTATKIDLEGAIACLPPQARTIFVLHDIEGYRHEEIAKLMGLASGTTKAQLHRARKLLKEVLRK